MVSIVFCNFEFLDFAILRIKYSVKYQKSTIKCFTNSNNPRRLFSQSFRPHIIICIRKLTYITYIFRLKNMNVQNNEQF